MHCRNNVCSAGGLSVLRDELLHCWEELLYCGKNSVLREEILYCGKRFCTADIVTLLSSGGKAAF